MTPDDAERRLIELLMQRFGTTADALLTPEAILALQEGRLEDFLRLVEGVKVPGWVQISSVLAETATAAGLGALGGVVERFGATSGVPQGAIVISFDVVDKNVTAWAERNAASLVVEVSNDMKQTIRDLVGRALNGEYTAQSLARELRQVVPLHSRYANAVMRRNVKLFEEGIRSGMTAPRAAKRAAQMTDTYARKLLRSRAKTIARTEIMTASNYGQFEGYRSAINAGVLNTTLPGMVTKEWVTAADERVCPVCGPLHEKTADFAAPFSIGVLHPPAHPNCRCSYNVIVDDQTDFDGAGTPEEEFAEMFA